MVLTLAMEGHITRMTITFLYVLILGLGGCMAEAKTRRYNFDIKLKKVSRLCHNKYIVTANGQYPGPTIYAREGDTVLVNVTNHVKYNVSIHWHGIRQLRTAWADGPAYITQCPIQTGQSYVYNFTVTGQRGTLFWHAHILWLRATLHGALIILPKKGVPYPFPAPYKEHVLVLGEWWNSDTEKVINDAMKTGGAPNVSDAHTINGNPGSLPELSALSDGSICKDAKHTYALSVKPNKTYMFRIVNAALNDEVFFDVAGHHLTVVEVDATYTKPFVTKSLLIAPGQTSNVLLRTNKDATKRYFITVRSFMDAPVTVDNKTTTAILQYEGLPLKLAVSNPELPIIPAVNDSALAANLSTSLRSLNSEEYPARVPKSVGKRLIFTVGLGLLPCPTCQGGMRAAASMNNVSFIMPKKESLLEAHFFNISGVFTTDFPEKPHTAFNYTAQPSQNMSMVASTGTRVTRLAFNETVELVFQGTTFLAAESHPIHLHGFNFFVVGRGVGNFNAATDPAKYNFRDPVERNTVGVPAGGWTAIRFRADNPGVWFMHCHLEVHTTWGLKTAFVVDNGPSAQTSILPPPHDLPKC